MYNKKVFLDDSISVKEKSVAKKDAKSPLLQIFFNNNNKKDTNIDKKPLITNTQQSSKFNSSFNFNFQKKSSEKNLKERNVQSIKKLKNIKYVFNNEQIKNNDNCSLSIDNKTNENQMKAKFNNSHLYESRNIKNKSNNNRNTISVSLNDNSLFPTLIEKTNLFRIKKNENNRNNKNNLDEINRPNDLIYNNINLQNFNNNSIVITESRPSKFTFFKKYLGDKIISKKSVHFNNKNIIYDESYLNKISSFKINTEKTPNKNDKIYINEINKSNNSNTIILNLDEKELSTKKDKIKNIKFNTLQNDIINNKMNSHEKYPEIKKKNNIQRNNMKTLKLSLQTFTPEKSRYSQNKNNDINKKKIFSLKRNENKKILKKFINPLKKLNNNLKTTCNTNENFKENIEIYPLNQIYNSIKCKNNDDDDNDDNSFFSINIKNNDIIKFFIKKKKKYNAQDKIIINKLKKKDEKKYKMNERLKMKEKVKNHKKGFNKKKYIKNSIIDIINTKILNKEVDDKIKEEQKKIKLKKKFKYFKDIFKYILTKPNDQYYFEKTDKLGLYFYIEEIIDPRIKIQYNLEMFDIYQEVYKDFKKFWNNKYIDTTKKLEEFFSIQKIINYKSKNNNNNEHSDFYDIIDEYFFLYKERIKNEFNLYFESINFYTKFERKKKTKNKKKQIKFNVNNEIVTKPSMKNLKFTFKRSKTINLTTLEKSKTAKNEMPIKENSKNEEDKKSSNNSKQTKIKKEIELNKQAKSNKKYVEIQEEEAIPKETKKKINISNIINNNNKEIINEKEMEKIMAFNDISIKIENFNALKNIHMFNIKKQIKKNDDKNNNNNNILLEKKENNNEIKLDLGGTSNEEIENQNQKNDKDLSDVDLFNDFISILKNRDIDKYFYLLNEHKNSFNNILNRKELITGNTLLIYATKNNLKSIVESLLLKGADPNIQNILGNSALHIAYKNNNNFLVNLLIEYNADQNLKNIKNIIPKEMNSNYNV